MLRRASVLLALLVCGALTACGDDGPGDSSTTTSTTTSTTVTTASSGGAGGSGGTGVGGTGAVGGSATTGGTGGSGGTTGSGGTAGNGGTGGAAAICGDGAIAGAEVCDDGNAVDGDGCSALCAVESGFDCNGAPSVCVKPLCEGVQKWDGPTMSFPACFAYVVDMNFDANNCEFFVDKFGRGSFSANGASGSWIEADYHVGSPDGEVENAGMFTRYLDEASVQHEAWTLGSETSPGLWHTGFTWKRNTLGPGSFSYTVVDFAFFIDVHTAGGDMVRLWLSNGGANYTVAATYAVPGTTESMGATTIEYAADQAALFDQKHVCMP